MPREETMTEWILILLITVSGFVKGVDVDAVTGFQTKDACEAAASTIKEHYKNSKKLITLCVPTNLDKDLTNR